MSDQMEGIAQRLINSSQGSDYQKINLFLINERFLATHEGIFFYARTDEEAGLRAAKAEESLLELGLASLDPSCPGPRRIKPSRNLKHFLRNACRRPAPPFRHPDGRALYAFLELFDSNLEAASEIEPQPAPTPVIDTLKWDCPYCGFKNAIAIPNGAALISFEGPICVMCEAKTDWGWLGFSGSDLLDILDSTDAYGDVDDVPF